MTVHAVLTDLRLPGLYRQITRYAGLPVPPEPARGERFVVRSGTTPPTVLALLLEEVLVDDEAEVVVWQPADPPDYAGLGDGGVAVRPGFDAACPDPEGLRAAAGPGPALVFAIERRAAEGWLLGVTWVALPEGEPPPEEGFRAAVLRADVTG